jgi:hypothetical protein
MFDLLGSAGQPRHDDNSHPGGGAGVWLCTLGETTWGLPADKMLQKGHRQQKTIDT